MWDDSVMDASKLGPLRVRTIVKGSGTTTKNADQDPSASPLTVVLMHGYGAAGDDLVSMAGAVDAPAGTTFVFPEAPLKLVLGAARAWWPVDIGRYERAMRQGGAQIEELIHQEPDGMSSAREA